MDQPSASSQPTLVLSLDTAGPACQAVVSAGETILAATSTTMLRGHGEALVPMVEEVLAQASVTYHTLDRIAVTIGPGSFTGMRVGLSAARAFSATLNIPVVGIGTLDALALTDRLASDVKAVRCVAMDARNHLVYGQRFDVDGLAMEQPSVISDLVFATSVPSGARLVGPNNAVIAALARASNTSVTLGSTDAVPSATALAQLGSTLPLGDKPRPLYLKEADAKAAPSAGLRVASTL